MRNAPKWSDTQSASDHFGTISIKRLKHIFMQLTRVNCLSAFNKTHFEAAYLK